MAPTPLIIAIASIAVHFVLREATFERAATRNAKVYFPPVFGLRAAYWVGIPGFLVGAYETYTEVQSHADWMYPLIFIGLDLLGFFSYPGTIRLDDKGIVQKRLFGLRVERLNWDEVASAAYSSARKEMTVFGKDGRLITHTRFHVDPSRFEFELCKRMKTPPSHSKGPWPWR